VICITAVTTQHFLALISQLSRFLGQSTISSTMSVAALGRLTRSASMAVAQVANGFHLLRIDGYSQTKMLLPGQKISSQGFTVGDSSWRVDCYPNGRDTSAEPNAMSVYLHLADRHYQHIQARYKFSLLDHAGNAAHELPAETGTFTSVKPTYTWTGVEEQGTGCGHEEFIGREELERRGEDLIRDDRIVIRCDVGVTRIDGRPLAADELSDEEEDGQYHYQGDSGYGYSGYRPARQRRRRSRTEDDEYVKWCLTQEPRGSRGYYQRPRGFGDGGW
jgi:speckle-type POZ protein